MTPNLPADAGPYEDERQAAATVREVYDRARLGERGTMGQFNRDRLTAACAAAGVRLGAYDERIIAWLAGWEPETVAVLVGLVLRSARALTPQTHTVTLDVTDPDALFVLTDALREWGARQRDEARDELADDPEDTTAAVRLRWAGHAGTMLERIDAGYGTAPGLPDEVTGR